jgi:hypothetical protein
MPNHTSADSACKLFFKEHFLQLLDELEHEFSEFCRVARDTNVAPANMTGATKTMSDGDFVSFMQGLRAFADIIVQAGHGYLDTHVEALELLKKHQGHESQTITQIIESIWENLRKAAQEATGVSIDTDLDNVHDKV